MTPDLESAESVELAYAQAVQRVHFNFGFKRRSFMTNAGNALRVRFSIPGKRSVEGLQP